MNVGESLRNGTFWWRGCASIDISSQVKVEGIVKASIDPVIFSFELSVPHEAWCGPRRLRPSWDVVVPDSDELLACLRHRQSSPAATPSSYFAFLLSCFIEEKVVTHTQVPKMPRRP